MKKTEYLTPAIYLPLFREDCARNVLNWGGRAAGRSVVSAGAFVLFAASLPSGCVAMAVRWRFNSLEESSKAEIESAVKQLGIKCEILNNEIRFPKGGRIIYGQMHDIASIKSTKNLCGIWIEEAQFIELQKNIHAAMNTVRVPPYARELGIRPFLIASMNRITPNDPVWDYFSALPDSEKLVTYATIDDNPFAPPELLQKRDNDKAAMERGDIGAMTLEEYRLEWEGIPSNIIVDGVYDYEKLISAIDPYDESDVVGVYAGVDLAYGGTDKCVYTLLEIHPNGHKTVARSVQWRAKSLSDTVGRIYSLWSQDLPNKMAVDAGDGGGMMVYSELRSKGIKNVERFIPGASLKGISGMPANIRAAATLKLGRCIEEQTIHNLPMGYVEDMKGVRKVRIAEGAIKIERKEDMRKRMGKSPDLHDSLVIANYVADKDRGAVHNVRTTNTEFKESMKARQLQQEGIVMKGGVKVKMGGRFNRR